MAKLGITNVSEALLLCQIAPATMQQRHSWQSREEQDSVELRVYKAKTFCNQERIETRQTLSNCERVYVVLRLNVTDTTCLRDQAN